MKDMYPAYADRVNFVAVGVDPTEGPDVLRQYAESNGYPWDIAVADPATLRDLNVLSTATKYALDRDGVVEFRGGYGVQSADGWQQVFDQLAMP